ncbi:transcriptional regulator EpsA [Pseudoduganella lurida]|uniref:Transcriptional regulator EpsA n=1 Tax=Pseudoduganella lurida TaxID=1036180 RepID=A0A562R7U0_9BURK|nr:LuxR C-terminal-related transcriptional regulator [Pseudoduganella lurida]TWI65125.1 transcriptional regulator EpsA [Pseudoduganella lurida]
MDGAVILSRQEQEYLLHAIEAGLDLRDPGQLFLWAQGQLQALLPHRALVCLRLDPAGAIVRTELLQAGGPPGRLEAALCDPARGIASAALQLWREGGERPLLLQPEAGVLAGRLAALGLPGAIAHGSGALPGGATFFLACGLAGRPGPRQAHFLRLLLPHLHLALLRLAPAHAAMPRALSPRELQVLHWLGEGKNNAEIGQLLGISALTVKNHLQRLYRVLGVSNRAHAVARSALLAWPTGA